MDIQKIRGELVDVDITTISSQNNLQEIEKEAKRLERIFYFYRDIENKLEEVDPLEQLTNLRVENCLLMREAVDLLFTKESKFNQRINHLWSKFIANNS